VSELRLMSKEQMDTEVAASRDKAYVRGLLD
jgi:hypothetical protein